MANDYKPTAAAVPTLTGDERFPLTQMQSGVRRRYWLTLNMLAAWLAGKTMKANGISAGSGAPTDASGIGGDLYIDSTNGDLYKKVN